METESAAAAFAALGQPTRLALIQILQSAGAEGLAAWALVTGSRGGAAYDIDGLCLAASRIGDLLLTRGLMLVEVNPLIVRRAGCVAVDAVVA